jgi:hypothetical protein
MRWRAWKLGCAVTIVLSLFVAMAGLAAGIHWQGFLAVLGAALVTHFGAFIKDHPVDSVVFDDNGVATPPTKPKV